MSLMLLRKNATVTICHSRTKNLQDELKGAKIVILSVGIPRFLDPCWIDDDAVVIDVGINAIDAPETKRGYRLVGDLDERKLHDQQPKHRVGHYTPVPGGVGPMTIASLLENTYNSFLQRA